MASGHLSGEAALDYMDQALFKTGDADLIYDVCHKSLLQQHLSLGFRQSSRTHIKQLQGVKLAGRGAMAALDVIVIDFELGFGEHAGIIAADKIAIALICLIPDSPRSNLYQPCKAALRPVVETELEEFVGQAAIEVMINLGIDIYHPVGVCNPHSV